MLEQIYKTLLAFYGPQGWWPVTPRGGTRPEYLGIKKPSSKEALEIAVGAVLTQNTSWSNVERAMENLNRAGFFKKPFEFSSASLTKAVRPAGYYNQKAGYLANLLAVLRREFGGDIKRLFAAGGEKLREKLLSVKGIGKETADSIILYAARKPFFVVDAYTLRIASRAGLVKPGCDYETARKFFESSLPRSVDIYSEFHALIVRHAKERCRKKNPACAGCVLLRGGLCRGVLTP